MAAEMSLSSGNSSTFSHSETFPGAIHATHQVLLYCWLYSLSLMQWSSHRCQHPVADSKWSRDGSSSLSNRFEDHLQLNCLQGFCGVSSCARRLLHSINLHQIYKSFQSFDLSVVIPGTDSPSSAQVSVSLTCLPNCLSYMLARHLTSSFKWSISLWENVVALQFLH